jgi:hypothetical protein
MRSLARRRLRGERKPIQPLIGSTSRRGSPRQARAVRAALGSRRAAAANSAVTVRPARAAAARTRARVPLSEARQPAPQ